MPKKYTKALSNIFHMNTLLFKDPVPPSTTNVSFECPSGQYFQNLCKRNFSAIFSFLYTDLVGFSLSNL